MIKTNIISNEKTTQINWLMIFAVTAGSVFLQNVILKKSFAAPLEIVIWYPLIAVCGFLLVELLLKLFFADWFAVSRLQFFLSILFAIIAGFFLSLFTLWGQIASGVPLTLVQVGGYLLTLGVYPFTLGPDGFLRGLAWGLALAMSFAMYKHSGDLFKALFLGLITWLGMAIVILLPSVVLMATFAFKSLPMAWSNTDLVAEFTRINLFSYWADGQILRWFTGFGSQAVNAMLLYTGSAVYIAGSLFWIISNAKWIKRLLSMLKLSDLLPFLPVVFFGYQAGLNQQGWVGIDWAAWLVLFMLVVFVWFQSISLIKNVDFKDQSLIVLGLLGGLLLGWSVLLAYLLIILLAYLTVELIKTNVSRYIVFGACALFWPAVALLIALFAHRGVAISNGSLKTLGVLAVFAIVFALLDEIKKMEHAKFKALLLWLVCAVLLWVWAGIFAPAAIMLLAGVFMWLFWQKILSKEWLLPVIIWSTALLILLIVIRLPELAKI